MNKVLLMERVETTATGDSSVSSWAFSIHEVKRVFEKGAVHLKAPLVCGHGYSTSQEAFDQGIPHLAAGESNENRV